MNSTGKIQTIWNAANETMCQERYDNETFTIFCDNVSATLSNGTGGIPNAILPNQNESQTSVIIRFFLTAIIFILIVIGNSLTIHVVRNNRNLTSIKNYYYGYYIVNLSISDLLVGLVCLPTTVLYYILPGRWILGLFLCKLFPTLQVMVVSASISTLTVITFERFSAIVHPLKPRSTSKKLWLKIAAIWIWSVIISLPSFIAYQINSKQQCEERGISKWYTILLFLVNYAVPLMFIFVTYIRMLYELKSQSRIGSKREVASHKRFIKLTIILVLGFAICYLPSNIIFFILEFTVVTIDERTITTMLQYFHLLVWFNSCLNPFIYGSVDTYFKRGFKKAFGLGSSCDSQLEKSNASRFSHAYKSERPSPSPATHRWLPPELPKTQSPGLNGLARNVRFQSNTPCSQDPLLVDGEPNFDNNNQNEHSQMLESATEAVPCQQDFINEKGYARTASGRVEYNSNARKTDVDLEENQELFVDLSARSTTSLEKQLLNSHIYKVLSSDGLFEEFNQSKETNL